MKVAVSVPEPVFEAAERVSKRLRIPRSQLYSRAVAAFVREHSGEEATRALNAVVLVPLARNVTLARAPGNVPSRSRDTGRRHPSVANVSEVTVADRRRLVERAGALPTRLVGRVEEGLRVVLGL